MRFLRRIVLGLALVGVVGGAMFVRDRWTARQREVDAPALLEKIREVARLQTLDVTVSKIVRYEPDPPEASSTVGAVLNWARWSWRQPEGEALVFATGHLGFDLRQLDVRALRFEADTVELALPPLQVSVELDADRTRILKSNLASQETTELFAKGRRALAAEIKGDRALRERARKSGETAIRALLLRVGFKKVSFVEEAAPPAS